MTPAYYEFMRKVFLQGSVPVTNAVPLAVVSNLHQYELLDIDSNCYVMTLKGKNNFIKYMTDQAIANMASELDDIFISCHLAEPTEYGYDGKPFSVSNETACSMLQTLINEDKLKNSEVAYDYGVFEFIDPIKNIQYRVFPDDVIVYTMAHGFVVHNFRKGE